MGLNDFFKNLFSLNLNKLKGNFGEILTQQFSKLFTDALVLRDVLIESGDDSTTQIDLILIESTGLYVVEIKTFSGGTVYGDGTKKTWYYYKNGSRYDLYSPLMQNRKHIRHLKRFLAGFGEVPCFSVILLLCDDFKVSNINKPGASDTGICNSLLEMKALIEEIAQENPEVYSDEQKQELYKFISMNQLGGNDARRAHESRVRSYKQSVDDALDNHLCPYCKAPLILRNGKFGKFYGCSNYPRCKYTLKADDYHDE